MNTLNVNLDQRVRTAPRYKSKSVADYFVGSKLQAWWKPTEEHYNQQTRTIEKWLKKLNPESILELGPGFGRISELLDGFSDSEFTLVDINKQALRVLKKKFPHRHIVKEEASKFSFEKNKYNLIVAIELLVHIPDIEDLVEKVQNSLTKDGIFITSITPDTWYAENWRGIPVTHRGINEKEFEDLISSYFSIVEVNRSDNNQLVTYLLEKKE
jgi:ubiquinone/menaquinone biosynthesis C-methylase UbiE